jgi:hypothetical protein
MFFFRVFVLRVYYHEFNSHRRPISIRFIWVVQLQFCLLITQEYNFIDREPNKCFFFNLFVFYIAHGSYRNCVDHNMTLFFNFIRSYPKWLLKLSNATVTFTFILFDFSMWTTTLPYNFYHYLYLSFYLRFILKKSPNLCMREGSKFKYHVLVEVLRISLQRK